MRHLVAGEVGAAACGLGLALVVGVGGDSTGWRRHASEEQAEEALRWEATRRGLCRACSPAVLLGFGAKVLT